MNPYQSPADTEEYEPLHDPIWWSQQIGFHIAMLPFYSLGLSICLILLVCVIGPCCAVYGMGVLPRRIVGQRFCCEEVTLSALLWIVVLGFTSYWYLWIFYQYDYIEVLISLKGKHVHLPL